MRGKMDIYLSSPSEAVLQDLMERSPGTKFNVLITRARMPSHAESYFDRYADVIGKAALDCGAFSLNSSNLNITEKQLFEQFCTYAKQNASRFEIMFSYDANFGPNGFEDNQKYLLKLEDLGIPVVPVVHNMKNKEVENYINAGYETIAVGKQTGKRDPSLLIPFVNDLHSRGIKTHLFGITDFELLASSFATSCDSKSWLNDSITGIVRFWNTNKNAYNKTDLIYFPDKMLKEKKGAITYNKYEHISEFDSFLANYGLKVRDLIGLNGARNRALVAMLYYKTLESVVNDLHLKNPLFFPVRM